MNTQLLECDCVEVCGWTKPHTTLAGECANCGTFLNGDNEIMISFTCETHGEVEWWR